jgi:c-di-GMP-binding flagellar brake protein YcgR
MSSVPSLKPNRIKGRVDASLFLPGTAVMFESPRLLDSRSQTFFRGCKEDEYIILDFPLNDNGVPLALKDGLPCVVRFLFQGKAFAFEAEIQKGVRYPYPFIFITYPTELDNINLRNSERHTVRLPVFYHHKAIEKVSSAMTGNILDLSEKGCLLEADQSQPPDTLLFLALTLPNQKTIKNLAAKVRRVSRRDEKFQLGLMFMVSEDPDIEKIKEYLSHLKSLQIPA